MTNETPHRPFNLFAEKFARSKAKTHGHHQAAKDDAKSAAASWDRVIDRVNSRIPDPEPVGE
jgi:hypothetical protein